MCESGLADIEMRLAERAESLRSRTQDILNQLRDQENALGFNAGINFSQLWENWQSLKVTKLLNGTSLMGLFNPIILAFFVCFTC